MAEKIVQAQEKEDSILDLLLQDSVRPVKNNLPTAKYEVTRLSAVLGKTAIFKLTGFPTAARQELKRLTEEADIQILLAGCVEPDLKSPALQQKFGGVTPAETVKNMLLPGEIADLSIAVEKLCGYRRDTIAEVKNG